MKVVQCWDDGVDDDVRLIEILRKHGAKASFNLNAAQHTAKRTSGWKYKDIKPVWKLSAGELVEVYRGFTIANHTATHPFLTRIPLAQAEREIRQGKDRLEQIFGTEVPGFAYPFGDANPDVEELVRSAGHVYARTTGRTQSVFPCANAMALHPSCHFLDPDFWELFDAVKGKDGVFYFWGHSYEMIEDSEWENFDAKIARITADPAVTWTDLPELFR
ncbi:MAG: polysaccharide deacetylase family protein [Candidatus Methylacidiphilales bacterium]|nr:polysaccharide deacetylase family protein [Candidatus Methylacidiphilales bacterium]